MTEIDLSDIWDTAVGDRPTLWRHCSPLLLDAGVNCAATPRRSCRCEFFGSHDHLIDAAWLENDERGRGYLAAIRGGHIRPRGVSAGSATETLADNPG